MRQEIDLTKVTQEQEQEQEIQASSIDIDGICSLFGLRFFAYKDWINSNENMKRDPEKREYKLAHFLHESGETTGVHFGRKRMMAEFLCNFAIAKASPKHRKTTLIEWAAQQGYRIKTELTPEQLAARERERKERYKE